MANKSAAELKTEGVELKALFAKIKKKPHNCAVLISKDGIVIEAHLKKSPEILLKTAKKAGGTPKGAWGIMSIEGQVIIVDPVNDKVPGSLTKIAKKFFSERGLKNRLEILMPDEEGASPDEASTEEEEEPMQMAREAEDEASEEEEELAPASGEAEDEASSEDTGGGGRERDRRGELEKRLKDQQRDVDAVVADSGYDMNPEMVEALKKFEKAMESEELDRATSVLEEIEGLLAEYAGFMEKKGPLVKRMEAMSRGIDKILKGEDSDAAREMKEAISGFEYNLDNSEWISAGTKLDWIEEQVQALGDDSDEEEETAETGGEPEAESAQEAPPDPEALEQSRTAAVDDFNKQELATLKKWLDDRKPKINAILKNRDSENGKAIVAALGTYASAIKSKNLSQAQDAIDEIEQILEKADREFSLSEKQREAILKELEKLEADIETLAGELED